MNTIIDRLKIIPKPDYISWEEITELLHPAFAERAEQGMKFTAVNQDVTTTINRVKDGLCLVALIDERLVGTLTFRFEKVSGTKKWYYETTYGYLSQLAVHPQYKRLGIGNELQKERLNLCYQNKVDASFLSTAYNAKPLIKWNLRMGAQQVDFVSFKNTNYYSVILRTPMMGKRFNPLYVKLRYNLAKLICLITFKRNGDLTWIGKIARRILHKSNPGN
jgi:GNAT superfamily N-acetyltransferase